MLPSGNPNIQCVYLVSSGRVSLSLLCRPSRQPPSRVQWPQQGRRQLERHRRSSRSRSRSTRRHRAQTNISSGSRTPARSVGCPVMESTKFEMYRGLPSKRPSPCKHPPPIFDDPIVRVYMYMLYTCKWLLCVSAHPFFFGL